MMWTDYGYVDQTTSAHAGPGQEVFPWLSAGGCCCEYNYGCSFPLSDNFKESYVYDCRGPVIGHLISDCLFGFSTYGGYEETIVGGNLSQSIGSGDLEAIISVPSSSDSSISENSYVRINNEVMSISYITIIDDSTISVVFNNRGLFNTLVTEHITSSIVYLENYTCDITCCSQAKINSCIDEEAYNFYCYTNEGSCNGNADSGWVLPGEDGTWG